MSYTDPLMFMWRDVMWCDALPFAIAISDGDVICEYYTRGNKHNECKHKRTEQYRISMQHNRYRIYCRLPQQHITLHFAAINWWETGLAGDVLASRLAMCPALLCSNMFMYMNMPKPCSGKWLKLLNYVALIFRLFHFSLSAIFNYSAINLSFHSRRQYRTLNYYYYY